MPVPDGRSRPRSDHRLTVEGMAWKYRTGAPWRDVPERFGKWNTIYKRFTRWAEDGTWEQLLSEVQKQADRLGASGLVGRSSSGRNSSAVIGVGTWSSGASIG